MFLISKAVQGFSLVEAAFSIGILSFGFLSLVPLLGLGLDSSRQARDHRSTSQIAETLISEAREGTLAAGIGYFDNWGNSCLSASAVYSTQSSMTPVNSENLTRVFVQVTPLAAPQRSQIYVVVVAPQ